MNQVALCSICDASRAHRALTVRLLDVVAHSHSSYTCICRLLDKTLAFRSNKMEKDTRRDNKKGNKKNVRLEFPTKRNTYLRVCTLGLSNTNFKQKNKTKKKSKVPSIRLRQRLQLFPQHRVLKQSATNMCSRLCVHAREQYCERVHIK